MKKLLILGAALAMLTLPLSLADTSQAVIVVNSTQNTDTGNLVAITDMTLTPSKEYYERSDEILVNLKAWTAGNAKSVFKMNVEVSLRTIYGGLTTAGLKKNVITIIGNGQSLPVNYTDPFALANVPAGNYMLIAKATPVDGGGAEITDPSANDNIAYAYIRVAEKKTTVPELPLPFAALVAALVVAVASLGRAKTT